MKLSEGWEHISQPCLQADLCGQPGSVAASQEQTWICERGRGQPEGIRPGKEGEGSIPMANPSESLPSSHHPGTKQDIPVLLTQAPPADKGRVYLF